MTTTSNQIGSRPSHNQGSCCSSTPDKLQSPETATTNVKNIIHAHLDKHQTDPISIYTSCLKEAIHTVDCLPFSNEIMWAIMPRKFVSLYFVLYLEAMDQTNHMMFFPTNSPQLERWCCYLKKNPTSLEGGVLTWFHRLKLESISSRDLFLNDIYLEDPKWFDTSPQYHNKVWDPKRLCRQIQDGNVIG